MIVGTGIDIIEIERVGAIMKRQPGLVARILREEERVALTSLSERRSSEYVAGRFAAKEAFSKAIGTGIGKDLSFHDIEVWKEPSGKPAIRLASDAHARLFADAQDVRFHVSISHSKEYAVAQVIIETSNNELN